MDNDKTSSDIKRLEREIQVEEKLFHVSVNQMLSSMNTKIAQLKFVMDQQRPEYKIYPISICDLWLRLRTLTKLEAAKLVPYLIAFRSHRNSNVEEIQRQSELFQSDENYLINPRRSRLYHLHLLPQSDRFDDDPHGYVGLMIFTYGEQERFQLSKHFCRQGDILIKKISAFPMHLHQHHQGVSRRGIYHNLFRWYFAQNLDSRFFGVGFIYADGEWRFDTITSDYRQLLPFEYRILDLFLLTHWLNHQGVAPYVQKMQDDGKELLLNQFRLLQNRLSESGRDILATSDIDFLESVKYFQRVTEEEIELLCELFSRRSVPPAERLLVNEFNE